MGKMKEIIRRRSASLGFYFGRNYGKMHIELWDFGKKSHWRKKSQERKLLKMNLEERKKEILQDLLEENKKDAAQTPEADWAQMAQEDMLDWIELQGIYIRQ